MKKSGCLHLITLLLSRPMGFGSFVRMMEFPNCIDGMSRESSFYTIQVFLGALKPYMSNIGNHIEVTAYQLERLGSIPYSTRSALLLLSSCELFFPRISPSSMAFLSFSSNQLEEIDSRSFLWIHSERYGFLAACPCFF